MDNLNQTQNSSSETPDIVLRCNRCNKPITPETAVLTPTGYRCKECVRSQQKVFDSSRKLDIPVAFVLSGLIAFAGCWFIPRLGFLTLLVSPGVGTLIANVVRWAVQKRRGRALSKAILFGAIAGCLPLLIVQLAPLFFVEGGVFPAITNLLPLIWRAVYSVMVSSTAYFQFTGIRLS